jgi:hypothetical protein
MNEPYDPDGLSTDQMGAKLDGGKPPIWRGLLNYFPNACRAVAKLSETGAMKYRWGGWSAVANGKERYLDASVRHLADEAAGEPYDMTYHDEEGGVKYYHHHLVNYAWNAMAALERAIVDEGLNPEYTNSAPRKTEDT